MAPGTGSSRREAEVIGGEPKLHLATFERGLIGLAATSTAITVAVREPPLGLDKTTYSLALSGAFFAGVIQVTASVWAAGGHRRGAGMNKLVYASLVAAAGLAAASLLH
ncbi:unnamed protein product [Urochloa humidicola]